MKDLKLVAERLKNISPDELEAHGFISRAPNYTDKYPWYICPFCSSGTRDNQTGGFAPKFIDGVWKWFCQACMAKGSGKDNIHIFAEHYGLDCKLDFVEIIKRAAQDFSIPIEFAPNTQGISNNAPKIDTERLKKINNIISDSQKQLKPFIDTCDGGKWRGLSLDTLQYFKCGYLPNWHHSQKTFKSSRLIIPASTDCNRANYLARLTDTPQSYGKKWEKFVNEKEHDGEKTLFNVLALHSDLILVVEGYIDAMSIWQASGGNIAVVALGGANQAAALLKAIDDKKIIGKKFILAFDADIPNSNKNFHTDLQAELNKRGNFAVCRFFYDFLSDDDKNIFGLKVDANQIIQARGDHFLLALTQNIIDGTQADFSISQKKSQSDRLFQDCLDDFHSQFGNIDPKILPKLHDAKNFIDDLTVSNFNADFAYDRSILIKVAYLQFYAPSFAQSFIVTLKEAKAFASATIKSYKKDDSNQTVDTTELSKLSTIAPSKISNEIDSLVVNIKRAHKDFLEQQKKEQDDAERDKVLAERKNNPLWSQGIIPDCPVNLFIPDTVYFSPHEIGTQSFDERGKTIQRPAAKTPIIVTKILREPSKHITQYEVAVKTKSKNRTEWRHIVFDGDELADTRKILRIAKDGGAVIKDARALTQFFADIISANEDNLVEIKTYQQPGWKDKSFKNFAYPTGGEDYIVRRSGHNYQVDFEAVGSADVWRKTFIKACKKGGAIARIFLGIILAAPLVRPLHVPNLQMHIYGEPNCGKSGLQRLGAAAFGNPHDLIRTFGSTLKNRLEVANAYNDLPTFLDELETLNGNRNKAENSCAKMTYEFFEGKGDQANKKDGTAREAFKFYGTRVSTAERPLLKSNDPQGAFKRLLQIPCSEKLFDDEFASSLYSITENNCGHFGKGWIDYISNNLEKIKDDYFEFCKAYASLPNKAKIVEPTLLKTAAVASLSIQHFMVFIGVQEKLDAVAFYNDLKAIIALMPSVDDMDEANRALADLQSYFAGHDKYFAQEDKSKASNDFYQNTNECYGKKFDNTEVAILPDRLKHILENELGYNSYESLVAKWAKKGLLKCGKGRGLKRYIRLNGNSTDTYCFAAGVLVTKATRANTDRDDDMDCELEKHLA